MSEKSFKRILLFFLLLVLVLLGMRIGKSLRVIDEPKTGSRHTGREVTVRFGIASTVTPVARAAAERLVERVANASQDTLKLTLHASSEFGGDDRMVKLAGRGELGMVLVSGGTLAKRVESLRVFDLPFLFPSRSFLHQTLDGDFGRLLLDKVRALNLEGIAFWDGGSRHWLADRPLLSPDSFAGLRVVEPDDRVRRELYDRLGGRFVAGGESVGVVDRSLSGMEGVAGKFGLGHLTLSGHAHDSHLLAIGRDAQEMLTARQQEILLEVAREMTWWTRDSQQQEEEEVLARMRAAGVMIHEPVPEDRVRFRDALAHVPDKFEEEIGADVMAKLAEWQMPGGANSSQGKEILIGLDAQLSGESALVGLELSRGARLAIEAINAEGGVLGRKLRLVVRDNHGLATRGLDNLRFFAAFEDLVAVLGGQKSAVVAAEVELVHDLEMPMLLPWSAARHLTENGFQPNQVFRLSLNDRWTAPFLADAALQRGARIALVLENSSWGIDFERIVSRHLNARGVRPVALHWVDNGQERFDGLVANLAEVGADVVMLVDTPDESIPFLMELNRQLPAVAVVSHWGVLGERLTDRQKSVLAGMDLVFPQTGFLKEGENRQGMALWQRYQASLGLNERNPVYLWAGLTHAYDLVRLLSEAIRLAGSTDRRVIRDALEHLPPYDGVSRRLDHPFDAKRHDALEMSDYRLARLTKEGVIVPAEGRSAR
ncbi:MAG: TRAP transporter substrate-binding protein DctP [Magnetococcus sp. YQC-9]